MASNDDRRNALLDTLEANAKAELEKTVPDLIDKADQGLRSLSKDDELSMITEIEGWDSDLVNKLERLGWLGDPSDQARDGDEDTNKQRRDDALDGLKDRFYNSVEDARNALDAKLKGIWLGKAMRSALDELEEKMNSTSSDWWDLLRRLGA